MQSLLSHRTNTNDLIQPSNLFIKVHHLLTKNKTRLLYPNFRKLVSDIQSVFHWITKIVWPTYEGGVTHMRRLVDCTIATWTLRCLGGPLLQQMLLLSTYILPYRSGHRKLPQLLYYWGPALLPYPRNRTAHHPRISIPTRKQTNHQNLLKSYNFAKSHVQ